MSGKNIYIGRYSPDQCHHLPNSYDPEDRHPKCSRAGADRPLSLLVSPRQRGISPEMLPNGCKSPVLASIRTKRRIIVRIDDFWEFFRNIRTSPDSLEGGGKGHGYFGDTSGKRVQDSLKQGHSPPREYLGLSE